MVSWFRKISVFFYGKEVTFRFLKCFLWMAWNLTNNVNVSSSVHAKVANWAFWDKLRLLTHNCSQSSAWNEPFVKHKYKCFHLLILTNWAVNLSEGWNIKSQEPTYCLGKPWKHSQSWNLVIFFKAARYKTKNWTYFSFTCILNSKWV